MANIIREQYNFLRANNPADVFVEDIAKLTSVSKGSVYNWIYGRNKPSRLAMRKIADYFSVDYSEVEKGFLEQLDFQQKNRRKREKKK